MNHRERPKPRVRTSIEWQSYFDANAGRQRAVPWETGCGVTAEELAEIIPSLRGWQLGETSDGAHLIAAAKNYAATLGDPQFVNAVQLFIVEEQRHGAALGRFLDLTGTARASSDWGDSLFRAVRYAIPTMEVWVTPVVMVETHAMVYYNAIRLATRSAVLRRICEQILADEVAHIEFQCERLAILHRHRPWWRRRFTGLLHQLLFAVTTIAVWIGHGRAFRAGGYGFVHFWNAAWRKMRHAWRQMDPDRFDWRPAPERLVDRETPPVPVSLII